MENNNLNQKTPFISKSSYPIQPKTKSSLIHFILITIVGSLIVFEYVFEDYLIEKTLTLTKKTKFLREDYHFILTSCKLLGSFTLIPPLIVYFFLNYPLSKTYPLFSLIIYAWYFSNLLDIIYGPRRSVDPKNYFENNEEKPSGHCLLATCAYLAIWDSIVEYYVKKHQYSNKSKYISILSLIPVIICISLVTISQVILEEHSFNMCIIGIIYGLIIYYIMYIFFTMSRLSGEKFFKIFKNKSSSVIIIFAYGLCAIVLFALYYNFERELKFSLPLGVSTISKQTVFNQKALLAGTCIFVVMGAHFGLSNLGKFVKDYYPDREEEVNNFNKVSFGTKIKFLILFILYSFTAILYIGRNSETPFGMALVMTIIPCFMIGYTTFGMGIVALIQLGLGNEEITKREKPIPMFEISNKEASQIKAGGDEIEEEDEDEEDEYDDENEDGDEDNFSEMSYNENDLFKSYDIVNVDYSSK